MSIKRGDGGSLEVVGARQQKALDHFSPPFSPPFSPAAGPRCEAAEFPTVGDGEGGRGDAATCCKWAPKELRAGLKVDMESTRPHEAERTRIPDPDRGPRSRTLS